MTRCPVWAPSFLCRWIDSPEPKGEARPASAPAPLPLGHRTVGSGLGAACLLCGCGGDPGTDAVVRPPPPKPFQPKEEDVRPENDIPPDRAAGGVTRESESCRLALGGDKLVMVLRGEGVRVPNRADGGSVPTSGSSKIAMTIPFRSVEGVVRGTAYGRWASAPMTGRPLSSQALFEIAGRQGPEPLSSWLSVEAYDALGPVADQVNLNYRIEYRAECVAEGIRLFIDKIENCKADASGEVAPGGASVPDCVGSGLYVFTLYDSPTHTMVVEESDGGEVNLIPNEVIVPLATPAPFSILIPTTEHEATAASDVCGGATAVCVSPVEGFGIEWLTMEAAPRLGLGSADGGS